MSNFTLKSIGHVCSDENGYCIKLDKEYIPALKGLEGFSYIQLLCWFDRCEGTSSRNKLSEHAPYKGAPETLGTFATRSPERPNRIFLSACRVTYIDGENGIIGLAYTDAFDKTPVLDIKPYTPSIDRVEHPAVPEWSAGWPDCVEKSGDFDWTSVFNF